MLKAYLNESIRRWHRRSHFQYQHQITDAILDAIVASRKGETIEIPIELPRQSGKTTAIVDVVEFILAAARRYLGQPFRIGIFAPEREQATTDFDRLKIQFLEIGNLGFRTKVDTKGDLKFPEKWNSKTIRIFDARSNFLGEVYIFPITKTSHPESKTLDIIIVEETQDIDDDRMKNAVFPMGASTNAPRIYIGTAGTRNCYYKSQLDTNPRAIKITLENVLADRRRLYNLLRDPQILFYEHYINHEIQTHGKDSDYIERQFFLKWKIGSGQFTTPEALDALTGPFGIISENRARTDAKGNVLDPLPCYVGIDTAKDPDQTWVTVVRDNPELIEWLKKKLGDPKLIKSERIGQLCNWLSIHGTNYEDQFEIIKNWLAHFENIKAIAIDATGQGDFMPDKFERHTNYNIMRVKFSAETKDVIYKNLDQVIKNTLTLLPDTPFDSNFRQFRKELIELEKEYKGRLLSVHHPERSSDGKMGHDDAPDSWALAEYAKTEIIKNEPSLRFL